jgi:hypothetical protein
VVVAPARDDEREIVRLLDAGADDYLIVRRRSAIAPPVRAPTSMPRKARLPMWPAPSGVRCHPSSVSSDGMVVP